ncbi:hypothetical protein CP968_01900 [Streptomyces subrutilus]|uniref:Uncharacterized protein n=1 Tax=Streptomyces subrutilus TaxID=36818 RepID=A0A5P2UE55_9ACTN|nr:hypothetical protein CP968_01900 [Streptomyces subrutilus]
MTAVADAPLRDPARARYFADARADLGTAWLEEPPPMDDHDVLSARTAVARLPITAPGPAHERRHRRPARPADPADPARQGAADRRRTRPHPAPSHPSRSTA